MQSFLLLYHGPATPPDASHEGWPEWFQGLGDELVDMGSPISSRFAVRSDGTTSEAAGSFNGYSIIRAGDRDEALAALRTHPFLRGGDDYTIQVFEVPAKS
ncbi:MAG TPA: hypothetical protein VI142_04200 [Gaiellaceae bacterium]